MKRQVPAGCRHLVALKQHLNYSSENINVIQRWGCCCIDLFVFPGWMFLSSSSRVVVAIHGSRAAFVGYPVEVLMQAEHEAGWTGTSRESWGDERGILRLWFWLLGCHNSFSPSFVVSHSKARKEACGLWQCQTPLWSPANCKEEGWNQNCEGKANRRMCNCPFIWEVCFLLNEQV